jgi:hypothetical protein
MNPISDVTKAVTSSFTLPKIVGWFAVGFGIFAALDALGFTDWLLYPISSAKDKWMNKG